jgi:hypothetical protein
VFSNGLKPLLNNNVNNLFGLAIEAKPGSMMLVFRGGLT